MAQIEFPVLPDGSPLGIAAMSSPEYILPSQYVHRSLGGRQYVATLDDGAGLYAGRVFFAGFDSVEGGRQPTVQNQADIALQHAINRMNNRLNDANNWLNLPLITGDTINGVPTVAIVNTPSATTLSGVSVSAAEYNTATQRWEIGLMGTPALVPGQYMSAMYNARLRLMQLEAITGSGQSARYAFAPSLNLAVGTDIVRATHVWVQKAQIPTLSSTDIQAVVAGELQRGAALNWIERI